MVNTKNYRQLHDQVIAQPGAVEPLASLRQETLAEIGLYEIRRYLNLSTSGPGAALGISQAAVFRFENAQDLTLSRLRKYLETLGAKLRIQAVLDNGEEEYSIPIRVGRKTS